MSSSQEVPEQNVTEQDREPEDNNEEIVAEKLTKWYKKTKMPTIALSLYTDKSGSVHVTYTEISLDPYLIEEIKSNDVELFTLDYKRKIIGAIVHGNDLKKRNIWKKDKCPDWWPENIPFRSPNARPPLSVDNLDSILSSFKEFIIAVGVNVESDEMSDSPCDEQVDQTIGSSGGQDAFPTELGISDNVEL
eukprot:gene14739-16276_t